MRIVIATEHLDIVGGTEKYLQSLIPLLIARGHSIAVVHGEQVSDAESTIDSAHQCIRWSLARLGIEQVTQMISQWQPDLIYCHGLRSAELEAALVDSYPSVLFAHGYYGTCASGIKTHSFPIIEPCARTFGSKCLMLYYPRRCGGLNPLSAWHHYRIQLERRRLLLRYGAIVVASNHMRREYLNHGVQSSLLHLLPYPHVDFYPTPDPPPWKTPHGELLYLGRLTAAKGLAFLLAAIPKAAECLGTKLRLTIAGSGPDEAEVRRIAGVHRVDADFRGWVSQEQKALLLRDSDLLAFPSVWPEPFGISGIEAASYGVPAVAFGVGGIPDWLIAGESGELADSEPPRVEGLVDAIVRALRNDVHYNALRMGAWTKSKQFSGELHVERLESVLNTVAGLSYPDCGQALGLL